MRKKALCLIVSIAPLLVFFGGVVRVNPQAASEVDEFIRSSQRDAWQFGERMLGKCGRH